MQQAQANLTPKQQQIALIAALTAIGDLTNLASALHEGLTAALTINEIKEILVQMYAYAGFPRSLSAINTFMAVLEERKSSGIKDKQGREASPMPTPINKYTQGKKTLETLIGHPDPGKTSGFGAFAPRIETFLKEHLFADIFANDILSYQTRELATVAALASMHGVEPMLQAHIKMSLNTGLTIAQIKQIMAIVAKAISQQQANIGLQILAKMTNS